MRRFGLLIAGAAVWLFLLAIPALADGGPHIKGQYGNTPAECAGCHRAHSATAPDILQQPMPALCYTCHGAGATGSELDAQDGAAFAAGQAHVAGSPAGQFTGALRAGGFEYALINTADQGNNRLATIGDDRGRRRDDVIPQRQRQPRDDVGRRTEQRHGEHRQGERRADLWLLPRSARQRPVPDPPAHA